jgi:hypothetical protein
LGAFVATLLVDETLVKENHAYNAIAWSVPESGA